MKDSNSKRGAGSKSAFKTPAHTSSPPTLKEVMALLKSKGSETTKRTFLRHGAPEPLFGVKVGDLKPLQRRLKGCQDLALKLYGTGNSDAMYLAGLIADGSTMTQTQLDAWANSAGWRMIAGCSVAWVTAEHPKAITIARRWVDSKRELTAVAGWSTLGALVSVMHDQHLEIDALRELLDRCGTTIHHSPHQVKYAMNNFVICCGTYVRPLGAYAMKVARSIGRLDLDMGDTRCKVPLATEYIVKCRRGAAVAPKRKTARC